MKSGVVATDSRARVAAAATTTENPQHEPTVALERSSAAAFTHVAAGLDLRLPERLFRLEEAHKRMLRRKKRNQN